MANNGGRRSSSAPGNNSSLILGILIGMVVGLAVAGGVAWHLSTRPSAFTSKEQKEQRDSQAAAPAAPATPAQKQPAVATQTTTAASAVANGKQHFTFYEILPDKESPSSKTQAHTAPAVKESAKAQTATSYFLQAGSFANSDDANKLKVKLALLGMESNVQTADVPGKGTYYRVRLGPYHSPDELSKAKEALKQNGINDAAQVRAQ